MKISSFVLTVLFIGFLFTSWTLVVQDFENNYVNSSIANVSEVNETYMSQYDLSEDVNDSFSSIQSSLKEIEDEGGWQSFASGTVAISGAFLKMPFVVLRITATSIGSFLSIGKLVGIPAELLGIVVIIITMFIIFKILSSLRRYET